MRGAGNHDRFAHIQNYTKWGVCTSEEFNVRSAGVNIALDEFLTVSKRIQEDPTQV